MFNKYSSELLSELRGDNEEEKEEDNCSFSIKHHHKKKPYKIIKITEIIEINNDDDENEIKKISRTNRTCQHICEKCKLLENKEKSSTSVSASNNNKKVTIKITGRSRSSSVDINEAIAENINSNGGKNTFITSIPSSPSSASSSIQIDSHYQLPFDNITTNSLKKKKVVNFKKDLVDDSECELRKNVLKKNCLKQINFYKESEENKSTIAGAEYIDLADSFEDICKLSDDDLINTDKNFNKLKLNTKKTNSYYNSYYEKINNHYYRK
jgi:DNA-binding protein YbaB